MIGPGKYDEICTEVREKTKANAVILIIKDGIYGKGFSMQTADPRDIFVLPDILRQLADKIEKDGADLLKGMN